MHASPRCNAQVYSAGNADSADEAFAVGVEPDAYFQIAGHVMLHS